MKSIPIALVVVVVAVISQTKGMKLSELIADTKQGSFCVPCQMFVSGIVNIAEEAIDWLNQEIEDLCDEDFAGNSTAVDVCKTKIDTVITKIREFIENEEAPEVLCQKFHLC